MINQLTEDLFVKNAAKLSSAKPFEKLKQQQSLATPLEREQAREIKKKVAYYMNKKDYQGALKYLAHAKKQVTK